MKDLIGNELAKGKRVMVKLPDASIQGYVADVQEASLVSVHEKRQGRVIISCMIALPADDTLNQVAQCVVVEDPDKVAFEMAQAGIVKAETAN